MRGIRSIKSALPLFILAAAIIGLPPAGRAAEEEEKADSRSYAECLAMVNKDAEEAYETAIAWRDAGGGEPAKHCAAIALLGLGQYGDAAERLETLAKELQNSQPELSAETLSQAAQAWMLADKPGRAVDVVTAALKLDPGNPDLLVDRSVARALAGEYWESVDDLNQALEQRPDDAEALMFRASAYRYLESLELARQDIDRAVELRPKSQDALLERGIIRRLEGDDDGARADWLKVLQLAPDSPAADNARLNLEKLDVDTSQ